MHNKQIENEGMKIFKILKLICKKKPPIIMKNPIYTTI